MPNLEKLAPLFYVCVEIASFVWFALIFCRTVRLSEEEAMKNQKCPKCHNTGRTMPNKFCDCPSGVAAEELEALLTKPKSDQTPELNPADVHFGQRGCSRTAT